MRRVQVKIKNTQMAGGLLSVAVSAAMAVPALVSAQESIEWLTLG